MTVQDGQGKLEYKKSGCGPPGMCVLIDSGGLKSGGGTGTRGLNLNSTDGKGEVSRCTTFKHTDISLKKDNGGWCCV
jgi:hypothetical protein